MYPYYSKMTLTYGQYKNAFIEFDKSKKMIDYFNEQLYYNVFFCYLQRMLEHLSETQNPHNEWLWLRGQYKKGMRYIEYTLGLTNIVDQNIIRWSYEEMMHNLQEDKHFCMFCFDTQSPEELLQEIVKDKNSKGGILKRVFKFFSKLVKTRNNSSQL